MRIEIAVGLSVCFAFVASASAAEPINADYVRSLAAPGKTVLVVEYYDGQGGVAERKGYASAAGFKAVSPTAFKVENDVAVQLYGIEPCRGDMVNRQENFAGTCDEFASRGLETLLQSPKAIFCRAFVSEIGAPVQNATCYGYYHFPGSLDSVDMFEEQLVSLGTHRIAKKRNGSLARPDLAEAEKIGRGGFGMWADPRINAQ
jgi:hypothetical protein